MKVPIQLPGSLKEGFRNFSLKFSNFTAKNRKIKFFIFLIILLSIISIFTGVYIWNKNRPLEVPKEKINGEIILSKNLIDSNKDVAAYQKSVGGTIVDDSQAIPGRYALKFVPGKSDAEISAYVASIGGTILKKADKGNFYYINLPVDFKTETLDANLVSSADQDVTVMPTDLPNDPMLSNQWALKRMKVTDTFDKLPLIKHSYKRTLIAVIDTGACFDHPDLAGVFTNTGYDYYDFDNNPSDEQGHGCEVSGVIAAVQNNALGISGVTPAANIIPYKIFGATGGGSLMGAVLSMYDAVDAGASIINMSFGGSFTYPAFQDAINYASSHGVTVVAAAGNNASTEPFYPAAFDNVIAVGSVDENPEIRSWFSNYGSYVDTWAPGSNILTTALGGGYITVSGTSVASPYVVGLFSLENIFCRHLDLSSGAASIKAHPESAFDQESCYPNNPPVITSSNLSSVITTADKFNYTVIATDGNADKLTFSLVNAPSGMNIDSASGVIIWDSPTVGTFNFTIKASDGITATETAYALTVNQYVAPPPPAPVAQLRTPLASAIFTNGEAEYASWTAAHPGYTCASTEVQVLSNKGSFEVWACGGLDSNTMLGLQAVDDASGQPTSDRLPVKYAMPNRGNTTPYGSPSTRYTNGNGSLWGQADLVNAMLNIGWP